MNWGKGIALFYGLFVIAMIVAVFMSTRQDNSLVSDHYYQDDIRYQQHYNRVQNSRNLENPLEIIFQKENQKLVLEFPDHLNQIQGNIHFFCPSDPSLDRKIDFKGRYLEIPTNELKPTLYKVKVNWESEANSYYDEKTILF
jgi:hypothetical protein